MLKTKKKGGRVGGRERDGEGEGEGGKKLGLVMRSFDPHNQVAEDVCEFKVSYIVSIESSRTATGTVSKTDEASLGYIARLYLSKLKTIKSTYKTEPNR